MDVATFQEDSRQFSRDFGHNQLWIMGEEGSSTFPRTGSAHVPSTTNVHVTLLLK
jgi:hypothetical protein